MKTDFFDLLEAHTKLVLHHVSDLLLLVARSPTRVQVLSDNLDRVNDLALVQLVLQLSLDIQELSFSLILVECSFRKQLRILTNS